MKLKKLNIILLLVFSISLLRANEFVIVREETLFTVENSAQKQRIEHIIGSIIESGAGNSQNIFVERTDSGWCVEYDTLTLVCFSNSLGDSAEVLAQDACQQLTDIINNPPKKSKLSWNDLFKLLLALLAPIVFVVIIIILNKIVKKIVHYLLYQEGKLIKGIKLGKFTILPARDELLFFINIVRWTRTILAVILFYVMLLFIFHLYPATQQITDSAILFSIKMLGKAGIIALKVLGYAAGGFIFYLLARIVLKIVDLIFRHYMQNSENTINSNIISNFRTLLKIFISILFVLGFIAIIPKYGYVIAGIGLLILLSVFGISFIPILKQYILGFTIYSKKLIFIGDKISFENKWWLVLEISPLFVKLKNLSDNEIAIVPLENILDGGFIIQPKQKETETNSYENETIVPEDNLKSDVDK